MKIFICVFFFFSTAAAQGKTEFSPRIVQAYLYLFKLKLDSTQIVIRRNEQAEPDNEMNSLIYNYVEVIRILLSEEYQVYLQWQNRFTVRTNGIKLMPDDSPFKQYILGEMYIQSSMLKFKFSDQMGALVDFKRGYGYLSANEKKFPSFAYHKKTLGFVHIILSYVPNKYKWFLHTFGFNTDFDKGVLQLKAAQEAQVATKHEAFFLQQWISIIFDSKTEESLKSMTDFLALHPDFVAAKWSLIMALKHENRVDEALQLCDQIKPNSGFYYSPYFYFINAQMQIYKGNYEKCKAEMQHFLTYYKGKMLRQSGFYFLFLADYLVGRYDKLSVYKDSVLNTPESGSEQDRVARLIMLENDKPTIEIVKARLYFDGGYYNQSLEEINKLQSNVVVNHRESVELLYRKARLLEKMKDKANALNYYKLAIEKQKLKSYYFAPFCYLQMAKILLTENPAQSKNYIKRIDDYDDYEYQAAIAYEAKALLKKLR